MFHLVLLHPEAVRHKVQNTADSWIWSCHLAVNLAILLRWVSLIEHMHLHLCPSFRAPF